MAWDWNQIGDVLTAGLFNFEGNATTQEQMQQGEERYNRNTALLESLIPQYKEQYDSATAAIADLLKNNPNLDLSQYKDQLAALGVDLDKIQASTSKDVSGYLSKGEGYISSMLDVAKKSAREEMPGTDIYRDTQKSSLAESIQQLKSIGGMSSSNVSSIISGGRKADAEIALESEKYKTAMNLNLEKAFGTAAGMTGDLASKRLGLGEFGVGIKKTKAGLTSMESEMATSEFTENEMTPWLMEIQNEMEKQKVNNPLQFAADVYGTEAGIGWSQEQSGLISGQQSEDAATQNSIGIMSLIGQMFG